MNSSITRRGAQSASKINLSPMRVGMHGNLVLSMSLDGVF
jgi:hypothetical protein